MKTDELADLDVIITRPLAQAAPWAQQLEALGASATVIPLLEIVPVSEADQVQAIKNCILDLDLFSKVIFVSQNAVEQGFEWIENYWPQLPIGVEFFAIGETTARLLQARGAPVTDLARSQHGAMDSEALLESPALQAVAGEKILICRGLGGRPHLGQVLEARGAQVCYCELYERRLPEEASGQFARLLQQTRQGKRPRVITLHSGEALENLQKAVPQGVDDVALLVPSLRIAAQAQAAGFAQVIAAQNATDAAMLQGLKDLKHKLTKV